MTVFSRLFPTAARPALAGNALLVLILTVTVGAGCPEDLTDPEPTVASLAIVTGDGQTGIVGASLDDPLVVKATDETGTPVEGAEVSWSVAEGAGSLSAATSTTDEAGLAQVTWTLGTMAGEYQATASAGDAAGATFTATAAPGPPASLDATPDTVVLEVGATRQLEASAADEYGNALDTIPAWASRDESVAVVDGAGLVTAQAAGDTWVVATLGDVSDSVRVSVPQTVGSVAIEVPSGQDTLKAIGDTVQLTATVRDTEGNPVTDAVVVWTTADTLVATLADSTGAEAVLVAVGNGTVPVVAAVEGVADTAVMVVDQAVASVDVAPAEDTVFVGSTVTLTATATDSNDVAVDDATVVWSSSDTTIAVVDSAGNVTGREPGAAVIRAETPSGIADSADVTVMERVAVSLEVEPPFATVDAGANVTLSALPYDILGDTIGGVAAAWSTTNTAVATVGSEGSVTGVAAGVAGIAAQVDQQADTATVAVLESTSILSTAFAGATIEARAAPGDTVEVPVTFDMSRVSSDGDLGSAQFDLAFDAGVLAVDTVVAGVAGTTDYNVDNAAGTVSFAVISTSAQGSAELVLATVRFVVASDASAGTVVDFQLTYPEAPARASDFSLYDLPVAVGGRLTITQP